MPPLVHLEDVSKVYETGAVSVHALREISLTIAEGEYVAIMGKSGSGKSTLLNLLGCLDRPTTGHYLLGDKDVSQMDDNALSEARNRRIGFVFQSFNLIQWLSVVENIEVPLFYQGVAAGDRRRISMRLAESVGLADRAHHRPGELSGGQQQRVAIARSLANDPLILLADEPTGNLDSQTTDEILSLLAELHHRGRTVIMVTHEPEVAERAQRVVTLRDGQVESDCRNAPACPSSNGRAL
jgi:putative ABC transport system ATP-binding protein